MRNPAQTSDDQARYSTSTGNQIDRAMLCGLVSLMLDFARGVYLVSAMDFDSPGHRDCWLGTTKILCGEKVIRPLQTVANLLAGLREGDYSIRAHTGHRSEDSLAEIGVEINALEAILRGPASGCC